MFLRTELVNTGIKRFRKHEFYSMTTKFVAHSEMAEKTMKFSCIRTRSTQTQVAIEGLIKISEL